MIPTTHTSETAEPSTTRRDLLRLTGAAAVCLGVGASATPTAAATTGVPTRWSTNNTGTVRATAVTDGTVFVGTDTGQVRALGAANGVATAEADLVQPVALHGLAVAGDDVVVVTRDNRLRVLARETLAQRWEKPISARAMGVVAYDDRLAYTTVADELVVLDRDTGAPAWRVGLECYSQPFVVGPYVLVHGNCDTDDDGYSDDALVAFDRTNGDVRWCSGVWFDPDYLDSWRPSVVRAGDRLLAAKFNEYESGVVALDFDSGDLLWQRQFQSTDPHGVVAADESVTVIRSGDKLRALSTSSGETLWSADLTVNLRGLALADGTVYAAGKGSQGQTLLALTAESGVIEWEHATGSAYERLVTNGDWLYAVDPGSGAVVSIPRSGTGSTAEGTGTAGTDAAGEAESDGLATFLLTGKRTTVDVGDTATITLSVINHLTSKPMTAQLLLATPSGVSVVGVDGAEAGSNQVTATTTVPPGGEANVDVHLQVNEPGEFSVTGRYFYHFGDSDDARGSAQVVNVVGRSSSTPARTETDSPGFSAPLAVAAILGAAALSRLRGGD